MRDIFRLALDRFLHEAAQRARDAARLRLEELPVARQERHLAAHHPHAWPTGSAGAWAGQLASEHALEGPVQVELALLPRLLLEDQDGRAGVAVEQLRKELEGYLECGLLCHGFARLKCGSCDETRLVAFSCKGRGFCPSCLGRKMSATAAHLIEDVLPPVDLRQWVLTVPFAWRKRLGYDGRLMSALTRIFVKTVLGFYRERGGGPPRGQSGAVVAVQRTSSDLKLNPHVHAVFLDGAYRDKGDELDDSDPRPPLRTP